MGLFQVKERRRGTCAGGSRACGHVPRLCFLPVGPLLSCSLTGPRTVSFQIHSRLDISSPSPELRPSLVWRRAGNTQARGLKGSQGDSRAPAGGGAGDEGGRPQRAPQQHWKDSTDALAHSGMLPGLALRDVTASSSGDAGSPVSDTTPHGPCGWALLTMASVFIPVPTVPPRVDGLLFGMAQMFSLCG